MPELISVIIPTFNRSSLLQRALRSVLNQNYPASEIIIVDDGSTDNTYEELAPLLGPVVKYFKQENKGVAAARNYGIKQASGKWIAFLDSDDEWLSHKLQSQVYYIIQNPDCRMIYCEEIWQRNGARVNQKKIHQKSGGFLFEKCIQQCFIGPSTVMIEKDLLEEMNYFDESFVVCEDYDLWLKISSLYEIGFIPDPLIIKHGGHVDQLSTRYVAMDLWRLRSLKTILTIRDLTELQREAIITLMKKKAELLIKGFEKHGHPEAAEETRTLIKAVDD